MPSAIHYSGIIMSVMASQITGVSIVCSIVGSGTDQSKHQWAASLDFVRGIHRWPMNSRSTENATIWWRHHAKINVCKKCNIVFTYLEMGWHISHNMLNDAASYLIYPTEYALTHWGRVTHICVNKLTIIGSDNGLSPDRRQAIIWTNAGILLIGPLGTKKTFSEILQEILTFSFKKMRLKVSSAKRRPFCLGLNVLSNIKLRQRLVACFVPSQYLSMKYCRLDLCERT